MRTATIALKVNVDDTKLVGHSAHLKELAALLKAVSIQGTTTFTGMATAAGISGDSIRKLGRQIAGLNSAIVDMTTAITKYGGVSNNTTNIVNNNTLAFQQNNTAIQKNTLALVDLDINVNRAAKAVERKTSSIQKWGYYITRASAIVRSLGYLTNEFFTGLQKSAERIDLTNTLTNQFVDLEGKVDLIKFKTANMIDRESILRSMALMSSFNLPMQNFAEQVELVNKMAIRTGQSVQYMMDSFARGISRLSAPILDNLGIQVVLKDVYAEFAMSVGKSTDQLTKFEKQAAVTNYVLEVMKEKTQGIELSEAIAAQVRSVHNDLEEMVASITDSLTEVAVWFGEGFANIFGSEGDKYTRAVKKELSDVSKLLVEYKKNGVSAEDERYKIAVARFKLLMDEVNFLSVYGDTIQSKIEELQIALASPIGAGQLNTFLDLGVNSIEEATQLLKKLRNEKELLIKGPKEIEDFFRKAFDQIITNENLTEQERNLLQLRIEAYIKEAIPATTQALRGMLTGTTGEMDLLGYILFDPRRAKETTDGIKKFVETATKEVRSGIFQQFMFSSIAEGGLKIADEIIEIGKQQAAIISGADIYSIKLGTIQRELGKLQKEYRELVSKQEEFIKQDTDDSKKKAENVVFELQSVARKIAGLEKQSAHLRIHADFQRELKEIVSEDLDLFRERVETLSPKAARAEEISLQKALARVEAEELVIDFQKASIDLLIDSGIAFAKTWMPILELIKDPIKEITGKSAAIETLVQRLNALKASVRDGKNPPDDDKAEPDDLQWLYDKIDAQDELKIKKEKEKNELIEKRGALLAKFDETKDVREIDKLYVEYVRLSRAAEEAGVYFSSMFTEQDEQIRLIWLQANAVHALAQEFDNANTIATYLGGTLQGFVGQDVLKGLSDFATSMHNVSEAFRTQGDAYTHMSAATSVIKSFTDFLIKDKKKLAWVNMVFEVGQAWAAWATPGMQAKAVAHSISAATFGLIAGGVLKLPSGTQSTRTDSGKSITPPPITINVIGDIAQTEADRGVMIQRSLDEARRMGRI